MEEGEGFELILMIILISMLNPDKIPSSEEHLLATVHLCPDSCWTIAPLDLIDTSLYALALPETLSSLL